MSSSTLDLATAQLERALATKQRVEDENALTPDLTRSPDEVCLASFWRQATYGVSYYRCEMPARHLPGQMLRFDVDKVGWDDEKDELILHGHRGTAVWSYLGDDARARVALAWMDMGHRTLMECDDNYTQAPKRWGINWTETFEQSKQSIGYSHEQHRHLVGLVDGMIVSTEHLADVYTPFLRNDANVYVCRNSIDPGDWVGLQREEHEGIRVVYAGSNVHVFDYPLIKKALKWAHRQPNAEAWIWGFDRPPAYSGEVQGWVQGLDEFRRTLHKFDVGLCPLQNNDWNKSKSDIKAMEYAMAGILPVVARTESYAPWWRDIGWPYVASTEDEWTEIVRHLIKNPDEIRAGAAKAQQYVLDNRTIFHELPAWKEAILGE